MPLSIGSLLTPTTPAALPAQKETATTSTPGFAESVTKLVDAVDSSDAAANNAVQQMLEGHGDVHDAMIALQRAEMTLQLTMQVRNKLVQAYTEIMRMPV